MKRFLIYSFITIILFMCIPLFISCIPKSKKTLHYQENSSWIPPQKVTVSLTEFNQTIELDLESCVKAWLSIIVSEAIPLEALKAQAVAARSYLLYQIYANQQISALHHDAMLCNDNDHCVSFDFEHTENPLLRQAIAETVGEYLCHNDLPARCFFFSVSTGKTESALDVWGIDLPYLTPVESPEDSRSSAYQSKVTYPLEAFCLVLKGARHNIKANAPFYFGEVMRSETGHVKFMNFYGERFSGDELQQLFHLNSTNFTLSFEDKKVVFNVKGRGHGVGMSLYGAQEMAKRGENYHTILMHYYPGTVIHHMN